MQAGRILNGGSSQFPVGAGDLSGVKVGDLVSAQITGTDGKLTATAIQDPASLH